MLISAVNLSGIVPKGNGSVNKILDVCCGSKMFWFDKNNQSVLFGDIREENHILCDGRSLEIKPDMKIDFTKLPFADETYSLVVFDPPHLKVLGANSWMARKYGILNNTWQDDIRKGFSECLRVLKPDGVLIFKWNETDIKTTEILKLCKEKPLFGHISGKRSNTHWITFMKSQNRESVATQHEPIKTDEQDFLGEGVEDEY